MSEFSESYHLRSHRTEDAVELLRRAERRGYVLPASSGWVTFVAEEGRFEPDARIVEAANHPLLHYVCAEDHGWSFTLFENGEVLSSYRCDWDDDVNADSSNYSREAIQRIVPAAQLAEVEQQFQIGVDDLVEAEPAKVFAKAIGLDNYEWLSYDYLATDFEESPEDFREVIEVQ